MGRLDGRWTARLATLLLTAAALTPTVSAQAPPLAAASTSAERLAAAEAYLLSEVDRAGFPGGSYAFLLDGEVAKVGSFGLRDLASDAQAEPETFYSVASITKSFTGLTVLRLRDQGLLDLDAPVTHYLPWFVLEDGRATERLTVRHLLQHTSGLPTNAHSVVWANEERIRESMREGARELRNIALRDTPGDSFEYSNMNYAVLGLVIEAVSGKSFEECVRDEVFVPTGATTSVIGVDGLPDNHASPYIPRWGTLGNGPLGPGRYLAPASSGWSSATEMALIARALLGRGPAAYLSTYVEESDRSKVFAWNEGVGYGLGLVHNAISQEVTASGHLGTASHSSALWVVPEEGVGLVLLIGGYSPARTRSIAAETLKELLGEPSVPLSGPSDLEALLWLSRGMVATTVLSALLLVTLLWSAWHRLRRGWPPLSTGGSLGAGFLCLLAPTLWWFGLDGVRQIWSALPAPTGFGMGPMSGYPEEVAMALPGAAVTATAWALFMLFATLRAVAGARR